MPSYRLLVLTYHWPPFTGAGAARWSAMVRHLRGLGHEVTVVTTSLWGPPGPDAEEGVIRTRDLAAVGPLRRLLGRPDPGAEGGRAAADGESAAGVRSRLLVPDPFVISWLPFAAAAARRVIRRQRVDCVITSSPPDSVHLAGLRLGAGRPAWIADLRDGWGFEPLKPAFPTGMQRRIDARLERRVANQADAVTAATRPIAEDLERRLGAQVRLVPNAWDPEFEREVEAAEPVLLPDDAFAFVHTGTLSGVWGRDPRGLARALASLVAEGPERRRVRLYLAGQVREEDIRMFTDQGLDGVVEYLGRLPHGRAVALQRAAGALILVTSPNVGEASGKLFEYLASGRPIVAIGGANEAARIVEETATGVVVPPDDPAAILAALRNAIEGRLEAAYHPRRLDRYTYPGPAETLAETIGAAIERRRCAG